MKIIYEKSYIKSLKKLTAIQLNRVDKALLAFEEDPFSEKLHNHALHGRLRGHRAISAGFDLRIIFIELKGYLIVSMVSVGTHNQVY